MPDVGLDTRDVLTLSEIALGASVLELHVPSVAVGVIIDYRCVGDGVEVTCKVVSATRELFREDEGMEF